MMRQPFRYAAGDVAFLPTGAWQAPNLEGDGGAEFNWSYIPFPGSDNAADNQYLFGKYDQGWGIAANSPNVDIAKAYVAAFSEPATYQDFVNTTGFIPTQPTATLDTTLGQSVNPLLANYRVGYEQFWVEPAGAGQWANGWPGRRVVLPVQRVGRCGRTRRAGAGRPAGRAGRARIERLAMVQVSRDSAGNLHR